MALNFHPYQFPQEERRPGLQETVIDPLFRGVDTFSRLQQTQNDQRLKEFQMQMLKAKEAREQGQYQFEYGDPSAPMTTPGGFNQPSPRLDLYQPGTMGQETQYGNMTSGMTPDSYAPRAAAAPGIPGPGGMPDAGGGMVQRFRQWQEARRNQGSAPQMGGELSDDQLFAPGFGAKRREDYLKVQEGRRKGEEFERKGKESEAEVKLKGAQAEYYSKAKGRSSGRYIGWTPQGLETRKRNLLEQLKYAPLDRREDIQSDIDELDDLQAQTLASYGGGSAAGGEPGANPKPVLRRKPGRGGAPAGGGTPKYKPGQTAVNKKTGETLMFNGSAWVPQPAGR
jgi:hypothetical protein